MAGKTGIFSWDRYYEINENVWISGREIGAGDNLVARVRWISPTASAGVPVGSGFFHQATRPSPKAPNGATDRSAFALDFRPQLDQDTNRHIESAWMAAAYGSVGIWLPRAVHTSWKISIGRTKYTLPWDISGSAAVWPGVYIEPIVEVRSTNPGEAGLLENALTFVASSPGSAEFTLPNTTDDQPALFTGDLDAQVGSMLSAWVWAKIEVEVLEMEQGFVAPGEWDQTLPLRFAPSLRDYEAD